MSLKNSRLLELIKRDWNRGDNPIILVCGATNSGKTMFSGDLGENLNSDFNLEKQFFYGVENFALGVKGSSRRTIINDEAERELSSGEFWSDVCRDFAKICKSQRFRNNVYVIILPVSLRLAPEHREFINYQVLTFKKGQYIAWKIKPRYAELRREKKRFAKIPIERGRFSLPSFWQKLETFSNANKDTMLDDIIKKQQNNKKYKELREQVRETRIKKWENELKKSKEIEKNY